MAIDYTQLKSEIENDPQTLGLKVDATTWKENAIIADILNDLSAYSVSINVSSIASKDIREAIVPSDWASLSAAQRDILIFHTAGDNVNPNNPNVRNAFIDAFSGTTTINNLSALETRPGTRAEDLFGEGTVITHTDVAKARNA